MTELIFEFHSLTAKIFISFDKNSVENDPVTDSV